MEVETKSTREIFVFFLTNNHLDVYKNKGTSECLMEWVDSGGVSLSSESSDIFDKVVREFDEYRLGRTSITTSIMRAFVLWYTCGDRLSST